MAEPEPPATSESPLLTSSSSGPLQVQEPQPLPPPPRHFPLTFLLQETGPWLVFGVGFMFAGISIAHAQLLPRIYVCPIASCPRSVAPTPSNISHLQALMNYWLAFGALFSAVALTKLMAFQAWLRMKQRGNTIKVLQHSLEAIAGGVYNAGSLVLRTYNPSLGLFALINVGITAAISLVVAFSISEIQTHGQVRLEFTYPANFTLPLLTTRPFAFTTEQRAVSNRLDGWLLTGDRSHGGVPNEFQGTYVVPDNRTVFATNAQPGGSRIMTSISCSNRDIASAVLIPSTTDRYNITTTSDSNDIIPAAPFERLAVYFLDVQRVPAETGEDLATMIRYFWISNTTDILSNTTTSTDGRVHATQCNHTMWMVEIPDVEGKQVIKSSAPFTPLSDDIPTSILSTLTTNQAATLSLANLITAWWRTRGTGDFRTQTCLSGVLAPFDDNDESCRVDSDTWKSTVTAMLDAVVQTGVKSGNVTQQLWSRAESISRRRWWWQAAIPVSTLLAYVLFLWYTLYRDEVHDSELKELNLYEVITTLIQDKQVTESTEVGGIMTRRNASQDIEMTRVQTDN